MSIPIIRQKSIAEQTQDLLRSRISERFYGTSNRLPSEEDLASELGDSRATVRTALAALASERLVIRKQGEGTFINERFLNPTARFDTVWEFSNLIEQTGRICTIRPLGFAKRLPTSEEVEKLKIEENDLVISVDRLFLADREPVILSNNVIPVRHLIREVSEEDVRNPIREFLDKNCGETLIYALSEIVAVIPPANVAQQLNLAPGSPLLKFTEIFCNEQNEALVVAQNFYDTHNLRLRISRSFT